MGTIRVEGKRIGVLMGRIGTIDGPGQPHLSPHCLFDLAVCHLLHNISVASTIDSSLDYVRNSLEDIHLTGDASDW